MTQQTVGTIPEFTQDSTVEQVKEEVKEIVTEEVAVEEKETQELPAEKPDLQPQIVDTREPLQPNTQDLQEIKALQEQRVELLKEISELRGQRREIKKVELQTVQKQIDDLKDLHPEDITVIDRVLKAKGYMSKEEVNHMFYETVKDEELNKFLDKYPEYKPENDPNDINWNTLQKELGFYRMPENPRQVREVLERAHKAIAKVPSERSLPAQKRQIEVASTGGGGTQRSSPSRNANPTLSHLMETHMQGWSPEEIKKLKEKLE